MATPELSPTPSLAGSGSTIEEADLDLVESRRPVQTTALPGVTRNAAGRFTPLRIVAPTGAIASLGFLGHGQPDD